MPIALPKKIKRTNDLINESSEKIAEDYLVIALDLLEGITYVQSLGLACQYYEKALRLNPSLKNPDLDKLRPRMESISKAQSLIDKFISNNGTGIPVEFSDSAWSSTPISGQVQYAEVLTLKAIYSYLKGDNKKAFTLASKACEFGNILAITCFSIIAKNNSHQAVRKNIFLANEAIYKYSKQFSTDAILGYCYEHGIGVEKDEKKALELYSNSHHELNLLYLGNYFANLSNRTKTDKEREEIQKKAFGYYENAIAKNYVPAMVASADYNRDCGFPKGREYTFDLYDRAIDSGAIEIFARVGYYYQIGLNCKSDLKKAISLYTKAAVHGMPEALVRLAWCSIAGIGMQQDFDKAYDYFTKASSFNYADGYSGLAFCHQYGLGKKANAKESREEREYFVNHTKKLYEEAASRNSHEGVMFLARQLLNSGSIPEAYSLIDGCHKIDFPDGTALLGYLYLYGIHVEQDIPKALELLRGVITTSKYANTLLGICYEEGVGVEVNLEKAASLYKQARIMGCLDGIYRLGLLFEKGIGVKKQDLSIAHKLFTIASEAGLAEARLHIVRYYMHGKGVKKDVVRAFEMILAILTDSPGNVGKQTTADANAEAGAMMLLFTSPPSDAKRGIKELEIACTMKSPKAYIYLSIAYAKGVGVEPNINTARGFLNQALKLAPDSPYVNTAWAVHTLRYPNEEMSREEGFKKAVEALEKAASQNYIYAIINLARLFSWKKGPIYKFSEALKYYGKLLALSPDLGVKYLTKRANRYYKQGLYNKAITCLLNILPYRQPPETLNRLGCLYLRSNDIISATGCFKTAADQGSKDGIENIKRLTESGKIPEGFLS